MIHMTLRFACVQRCWHSKITIILAFSSYTSGPNMIEVCTNSAREAMPPKEILSSSKIARLKHEDLIAALHAWDVSFSSSDRELLLRAKLDEKISASQSGCKSAVKGTIVNPASATVVTTSCSSMVLKLALFGFPTAKL